MTNRRIPHAESPVELRQAWQRLKNSLTNIGLEDLSDPDADRIIFWDDSEGACKWLTASTGIQIVAANISTKDSEIIHDSLSGFIAAEHVDHSAVSVLAGTGLAGGGTLEANRTLAMSHLGLEALVDPGADKIAFWDESENAFKWLAVDGTTVTITGTTLSVVAGGIDHGGLGGLSDDDHTQYLLANGTRTLTGNLAVDALITIDGRDLSVDGAKLDGIEALADVTDADNVATAGAAMAGGAFHDGFSDFVANEHIDWTNATNDFLTIGTLGSGAITTTAGILGPNAGNNYVVGFHGYIGRSSDGIVHLAGNTDFSGTVYIAYSGSSSYVSRGYTAGNVTLYIGPAAMGVGQTIEVATGDCIIGSVKGGSNYFKCLTAAGSNGNYTIDGYDAAAALRNKVVILNGVSSEVQFTQYCGNVVIYADNKKLLFGEEKDASVYYDGTDLNINPKEVGAGVLKILGNLDLVNNNLLNPGAGHDAFTDFIANEHIAHDYQMENAEAGAITIGMPVYRYDAGEVKKGRADADGTSQIIGLVSDVTVAAASTANLRHYGTLTATTGQWDAVTGGAGGLSAGFYYYLSEATAGGLTATPPSTTNEYIVRVGFALSTTRMLILLRQRILI